MYTTRDTRGHVGVWLTLIFKVNCQGYEIYFNVFDIPDVTYARIDTEIKSESCLQPEKKKGHTSTYVWPWFLKVNRQSHMIYFGLFGDPRPRKWNRHQDNLCTILTNLVMRSQFEGSLTLNFKVIRQGHVNNFNIFEFHDLDNVRNNNNLIALSQTLQKISW